MNIDYDSLEMHILALMAHDVDMTDAFLTGKDIHKTTASLAFSVPYDEVTKEQRQHAKRVGFGLIYGSTAKGIGEQIGRSEEYAQGVIDKWLAGAPAVSQFIEDTHQFVQQHGYVATAQGFIRRLDDIWSDDQGLASRALRQSVNTRIQGTGAYLTNMSVIYINQAFLAKHMKSRIALTVHDSILIDCYLPELKLVYAIAKGVMENLPISWLKTTHKGKPIRFPITAEAEIGVTYNDMVDYDAEEIAKFKTARGFAKYWVAYNSIKDYLESGVITEEQYKEACAITESKKSKFIQI